MRHGRLLIILGCLLLPVAVLIGQFESTSICTICGESQRTREFRIPFTSLTYFVTRKQIATPLSAAIHSAGLLPATHAHQWLFASGGDRFSCAIGEGRHIFSAVTSPAVASFVAATAKYRGPSAAQPWVTALLDPNRSSRPSGAIAVTVPPGGFPTQTVYDRWRQEVEEMLGISPNASPP